MSVGGRGGGGKRNVNLKLHEFECIAAVGTTLRIATLNPQASDNCRTLIRCHGLGLGIIRIPRIWVFFNSLPLN